MENIDNLGHGGYCSRCNTIKPIKEFLRPLTLAQAKARGFTGTRRVEVEVSMCKACQPKARPIGKLRAGEIRQRVSSGDIDAVTARAEMNKRHARAAFKRKLSANQQVERRWHDALMVLIAGEWDAERQRRKQGRNDPPSMSSHINDIDNWLRYQSRIGKEGTKVWHYMRTYLEVLRQEREDIKYNHTIYPRRVTETRWEQLVDAEVRMGLRLKWADLTSEDRRSLSRTTPLLALYTPDE